MVGLFVSISYKKVSNKLAEVDKEEMETEAMERATTMEGMMQVQKAMTAF